MILARSSLRVRAQQQQSSSPSKVSQVTTKLQSFRKRVEDSRSPIAKDNWNKVAFMASADAKFANEVIKELDQFHKNVFEIWRGSKEEETSTAVVAEESKDNIFKQ